MQESFIKKIALVCSVGGLVLLYWYTLAQPINISKITLEHIGTSVIVEGNVEWKKISGNHVFMGLEDITGRIKLVVFNNTAVKLNNSGIDVYGFSEGDEIRFTGIVHEYPEGSGNLEIIYRIGEIGRI